MNWLVMKQELSGTTGALGLTKMLTRIKRISPTTRERNNEKSHKLIWSLRRLNLLEDCNQTDIYFTSKFVSS